MPLRRQLTLLIFISFAIALPRQAWADSAPPSSDPHHFDGTNLGGIIDLSRSWLVYGGDDRRFADPAFDDSHWQVAFLSQPLDRYSIHDQPIVWYRLHIQVPASAKRLSFSVDRFRGGMEAYVNGERVGELGQMTGGGELRQNNFHYLMPIPESALNGGNLVIAVRGAIGRGSGGERYFGGLSDATLGDSDLLQDEALLYYFKDLSSNSFRLLLQAITIFVLVALVIALPRQREFLALAISFVFGAADNIVHILTDTSIELLASTFTQNMVEAILSLGMFVTLLEFINLALAKVSARWIRLIQVCLVLSLFFEFGWTLAVVSRQNPFSAALSLGYSALQFVIWLPFIFLLPGLLVWNWRKRRNPDAGLLLIPVLLGLVVKAYIILGFALAQLHVIHSFSGVVPIRVFGVQWAEVGDVTVNLALLLYIILRVVRTVREGARYASEVEAAQTVQKVLLARSQQPTPGFKVETVYLPASEVGGDFFLVCPCNDGSLLAVVGDVAGKGMLAAMRVSVILGILRREDSRQPGFILQRLNEAMMLQGDMGLTTACCVRIERDGRYVVANAGHISPYIAGREVATAGALPLGIAPAQEYEEMEGRLENNEAFVLMSDGVVEARSPAKELLGFKRLADLTRLSAGEIANTAKLFGQEDDITVLSIACQGVVREERFGEVITPPSKSASHSVL